MTKIIFIDEIYNASNPYDSGLYRRVTIGEAKTTNSWAKAVPLASLNISTTIRAIFIPHLVLVYYLYSLQNLKSSHQV